MLTIDPMSDLVEEHFAVVYTPSQRRKRFPDNCVELVEDRQTAIDIAAKEENRHAARVLGPARSSEGFMLYYLLRWL